MNWHDRRVLITGAGGFIGSHLIERLALEGTKVRAFVHYNARGDVGLLNTLPPDVQQTIEIVAGDLLDPAGVIAAARDIEVIFHLGALIAIPYSYRHPLHTIQTNVLGTTYVLEAARLHRVGRVVHTSTSEVYGTARSVPIDEDHPLQGQSPYSASKIGADQIAESYWRAFDLPVATLRPFNTYGPRQSARAVIPTIIGQVLTRDEVHLGNVTATRDFTYVTDTVDGFLRAAAEDAAVGCVTNLGTGKEIAVGDLARLIMELMGKTLPITQESERLRPPRSEVERLLANNRQAQERLGWTPRVSLREGLQKTIEWVRANLERYRPGEYQI